MIESQEESRKKYWNGYYQKKLEQGLEFQDVVTEALYHRGIVVVGYASRVFQNKRGENMLGAEIKNDERFRQTGNLYIEVAEKSHPDKPNYTPSGIMRADNSWLYVIGDIETVWIFSTKYLVMLKDRYPPMQTPTSIAHLMPMAAADKYAIRKIDLKTEPARTSQ